MSTDLVLWLRQQLDEDDTVIARNRGRAGLGDDGSYPDYQTYDGEDIDAAGDYLRRFAPPRMAAEVDAKRRILDTAFQYESTIDGEWACCHSADEIMAGECREIRPSDVLVARLLALPYAGRTGYDESWRP